MTTDLVLSIDESRLRRLSAPAPRRRPLYTERFGTARGPARLSRRARDEWRSDAWHLARRLVRRIAGAAVFSGAFWSALVAGCARGW